QRFEIDAALEEYLRRKAAHQRGADIIRGGALLSRRGEEVVDDPQRRGTIQTGGAGERDPIGVFVGIAPGCTLRGGAVGGGAGVVRFGQGVENAVAAEITGRQSDDGTRTRLP